MSDDQAPTPDLDHPRVSRGTEPRFEIHVDDSGTPVGFADFVDVTSADGTQERIFPHTEVDEAYGGRGLASTLVRAALDATVAEGRKIVAVCSYVKRWVERHEEYQQHLVDTRPDHLEAVDQG
ncbi:GNAT family N-acetyltransferase [Propionibacteriaceae bacterium Y2011]